MREIGNALRAPKQVVANLCRTKSRQVILSLLRSTHAGAPNSQFNATNQKWPAGRDSGAAIRTQRRQEPNINKDFAVLFDGFLFLFIQLQQISLSSLGVSFRQQIF
jgi:hypothetical protein